MYHETGLKVLISGSRDWADSAAIWGWLNDLPVRLCIEGGQRGADTLAYEAALELGIPRARFWALWKRDGKRAGSERNQRMLEIAKPDLVICFPLPQSVGTWDMKRRAEAKGVSVIVERNYV